MNLRYTSRSGKKKAWPITLHVLATILIACSFFMTEPASAQTAAASGFRLIGTIQGQLGGAVFQDSAGKQLFFRLYEKLQDGTQIVKLNNDSILLKGQDGMVYEMYIARDTKTAASANPPVNFAPAQRPSIQRDYTERQKRRKLRRPRRMYEE